MSVYPTPPLPLSWQQHVRKSMQCGRVGTSAGARCLCDNLLAHLQMHCATTTVQRSHDCLARATGLACSRTQGQLACPFRPWQGNSSPGNCNALRNTRGPQRTLQRTHPPAQTSGDRDFETLKARSKTSGRESKLNTQQPKIRPKPHYSAKLKT